MVIVGVIEKLPEPLFMPVPAVALKNFTAVGGELPAGTVIGYEMVLVGFTGQPLTHPTAGAELMVEAVVESE